MASGPEIQQFNSKWQQLQGYAQTHGIKYNQYYPVFQMDSQRLLQYGGNATMSQAELEHALQAAADPSNVTQLTPSTAPNPSNVIHNTITDARNIFTGLGDIVIHPLHNGLADSIKNTWDLIDGSHHLQGKQEGAKIGDALTSTVLSWIPGAMDIGNVLKLDPTLSGSAGAKYLAEHPISSLLDVAPVMKFGSFVKDTEAATAAQRAGMTPEELAKAGPVRLAKGLIMNKKTSSIGPGGVMTIGDKFHDWTGGTILNLNPAIADMMGGGEKIMNHYANTKRALFARVDEAMGKLHTPQQVKQVQDIFAKAERTGLDKAMAEEPNLDPTVRAAIEGYAEQNQWVTEMGLNAEDGLRIVHNIRTGRNNIFSLKGHAQVISKRDAAQVAEDALLRSMPEAQAVVEQTQKAGNVANQAVAKLQQDNDVARQTDLGAESFGKLLPGGNKRFQRKTPFSKNKAAQSLTGTGAWMDGLMEKARAGEWETVVKDAENTLKRLSEWGSDRINVDELGPQFQALRTDVQALHDAAKVLLDARKKGSKMAHGRAELWRKQTPFRDQRHKDEAKSQEKIHRVEVSKSRAEGRKALANLRRSYVTKRREIRTRYAKARSDRENTLRDGTRNINERYTLAKQELKNRHLLARQTHQELVRTRAAQGLSEAPEIAPGAAGSPEAIAGGTATLEAARRQEIADLQASLPSRAELAAKQEAETKAAQLSEAEMVKSLEKAQRTDEAGILARQAEERKQLEAANLGKKAREGAFSKLVDDYWRTQNEFSDALLRHPSDNFQPVWTDLVVKHLIADERARPTIAYKSKVLAERYGWTQDKIDQLHTNKKLLAQLVQMGLKDAMDDPIFEDLDPALIKAAEQSAYVALDKMAQEGLNPYWIHKVSATQIENNAKGSAGIRLIVGRGEPHPNPLKARTWGLLGDHSKFDIQVSLDHATQQFLEREAWRDYVTNYLDHHIVTAEQIRDTLLSHKGIRGDLIEEDNLLSVAQAQMGGWNLEEFDPKIGTRLARWGEGKTYLNRDLVRAVKKLAPAERTRPGRLITKGTKLFRYSILGLSPRYTAHITFGGTMLLALHEPAFFLKIPQMLSDFKEGRLPEDALTRPSNMGTTDWQLVDEKGAAHAYNTKWGRDTAHYLGQENLEVKQGIPWKEANPVHWLRALADLNLSFTTMVTHMQQGLAYLTARDRAARQGMTEERAVYEGMKNVARVYGDLRRMSPFERDVARTVMPFYGWQKHILQYVMSFPGDHPWRAMMLANMAEQDIAGAPGGLPSRYQFLSFLGTPDAQGNVTALDLRAVNPLRDTANYATWSGLFSSLNPAVTGVLAAVDPQIIYGGNTLYPNLTYDQFYGVKEAGAQGNLLTAAEQFVPQIGGMQSALQLMGQRQGMNSSQLIKSIGNQLNFPWVPQTINIRQEAARTAIDQYQVTKQLAANAWQTGNFSAIADLGSVPDPRNADYETPVTDLQQMYNTLAKAYPGIPPSESAQPLPSVHL